MIRARIGVGACVLVLLYLGRLGLMGPADAEADAGQRWNARKTIRTAIRNHLDRFKTCYEAPSKRHDPCPRVAIDLEVKRDGRVAWAQVSDSAAHDQALEACLVDAMRSIRFRRLPAPVRVTYPFIFRCDGM